VALTRRLTALVTILVLATVAVAVARPARPSWVSVSESPPNAGAPAELSLRTTLQASATGELEGVELDLARGFSLDPRAADTCTDAQARAGRCPQPSTVGRGTGTIVVQGTYLPRTRYAVGATFYLARPRHRGDLAGIVLDLYETESHLHATVLGRVVALTRGPYGIALRFSDTDAQLPSGYELSLMKLNMLLGAGRTVTVNGHPVTDDLLTNPGACHTRGWPVRLLVESAHRSTAYGATAACRP
jgi:hypothetical protein